MRHTQQPAPEPPLLRGSLIVLRRKCGKPACACAQGTPHETPALSVSLRNVTQLLTLRPHDLPAVRAALRRYRSAVQDLDRRALAGVKLLRQRLRKEKAEQKRARR